MKTQLWIIITLVVGFLGFMMGYSVPPFIEVGFTGGDEAGIESGTIDKDLMKQYENLYKTDEE